jgi:hypothetical protein
MVSKEEVETMMILNQLDSDLETTSPREGATLFPKTLEDAEKVEDILATEMESLSLVERDKILFDIHGFSDDRQEEEEEATLNELLEKMDAKINKIHRKNKEAYFQAKHLNEAYVTDRAFRLMFLRGERYDPKLAAERLITHFAIKRDLFGSGEILGRDIRLSDLSDDDMESLESGFLQMFPTRDAAGRTIFSCAPTHRRGKTWDNVVSSTIAPLHAGTVPFKLLLCSPPNGWMFSFGSGPSGLVLLHYYHNS